MNWTTWAQEALNQASGLDEILCAAYDAFEDMLPVIRGHEDQAGGMFAAFVLSAASAADGRDAVATAPSLPPLCPHERAVAAGRPDGEARVEDVARGLASLSELLASRLVNAARSAADPGDQAACTEAARHAANIHALLTGGEP